MHEVDEMDSDHTPADDGAIVGTMGRRRALTILGAGLVALAGCGSSDNTDSAATTTDGGSSATSAGSSTTTAGATATTAGSTGSSATCDTIPEETAGPFPGDGSNGPDVLAEDGVMRQDIRTSLNGGATAEG